MSNPVVQCHGLAKSFTDIGETVTVLQGVSLAVEAGEQVAILGSSGCGKSTLLHLLGGLEVPTEGEIIIAGQDISTLNEADRGRLRNQNLGFIYQFHHLMSEFTALENVCMPLLIRGETPASATEQGLAILERVGLAARVDHKPGELSGGERQRTAIARALVTRPLCILADEPTGNLDPKTAGGVYELMLELNKELNTSFVVVTHDHELARKMDRILLLAEGGLKDFE